MTRAHFMTSASEYISYGWPVFVLGRSKRPVSNCQTCRNATNEHDAEACACLTCHGFYAATLDIDRVAAMLRQIPGGLLAIRTGSISGLLVVDIDPRNGGRFDPVIMPPTRAIKTGSDGWHLYYQHPGRHIPSGRLLGHEGIDIKADSGYVVAPPSRHPDTGRPYRLAADRAVEEIPASLREAITQPTARISLATGGPARPAQHHPDGAAWAPPARAGGISYPDRLLAAHVESVASAIKGTRRKTLYGAARGVARMVAVNAISHAEAVDALTQAGRNAEQTDSDIRAAIRGGFRAEGVPL